MYQGTFLWLKLLPTTMQMTIVTLSLTLLLILVSVTGCAESAAPMQPVQQGTPIPHMVAPK